MKKILTGAIIQVIILVMAGLTGYTIKKPEVQYVDMPFTVVDTVYVPQEVIVTKMLSAIHDTITMAYIDTVYAVRQVQRAIMQDSVKTADTYYGYLRVTYWPTPWDKFDYTFNPAPVAQIITTKYIMPPRKWYTNPWFTTTVGILAGTAIGGLK